MTECRFCLDIYAEQVTTWVGTQRRDIYCCENCKGQLRFIGIGVREGWE